MQCVKNGRIITGFFYAIQHSSQFIRHAHKVFANCLKTVSCKTYPAAHIRTSLAVCFMKHHEKLSPATHKQFTKTKEVNAKMEKPQVYYS